MKEIEQNTNIVRIEFTWREWLQIQSGLDYLSVDYDFLDRQRLDFTEQEIDALCDAAANIKLANDSR